MQEKSLVTMVSLIVLGKHEFLISHLKGYLHSGGKVSAIVDMVNYLAEQSFISANTQHNVCVMLEKAETGLNFSHKEHLPLRNETILNLAAHIAIGNQEKTKICIKDILAEKKLSQTDIGHIMLHQIIYCGFPCAMNGFAVLRQILGEESQVKQLPKRSGMMDKLYGKATAEIVYNRCQELSAEFNTLVQEVVYDKFWASPGLAIVEKSLVTIVTLISLKKEEQLKIHLWGFFNLGGAPQTINALLDYMMDHNYIDEISKKRAEDILRQVVPTGEFSSKEKFSSRHSAIIDLTSTVAIGDINEMKMDIDKVIREGYLTATEIEAVLLHAMMYFGVPCAIRGMKIVKEFEKNKEINS